MEKIYLYKIWMQRKGHFRCEKQLDQAIARAPEGVTRCVRVRACES